MGRTALCQPLGQMKPGLGPSFSLTCCPLHFLGLLFFLLSRKYVHEQLHISQLHPWKVSCFHSNVKVPEKAQDGPGLGQRPPQRPAGVSCNGHQLSGNWVGGKGGCWSDGTTVALALGFSPGPPTMLFTLRIYTTFTCNRRFLFLILRLRQFVF